MKPGPGAAGKRADSTPPASRKAPQVEAGAEAIVMTASGCGAMVREYGHLLSRDPAYAAKAKRISELADERIDTNKSFLPVNSLDQLFSLFRVGLVFMVIVPVMLGDAVVAGEMAQRLLGEGVYVIAFSFPVVPKGAARIRTQMSAAHTDDDIDAAVAAFTRIGREMGVVR